jgi:hypothetical protein
VLRRLRRDYGKIGDDLGMFLTAYRRQHPETWKLQENCKDMIAQDLASFLAGKYIPLYIVSAIAAMMHTQSYGER